MKKAFLVISMLLTLHLGSTNAKTIHDYLALLDEHPSVQRVLQEKEALEFQADGALGLPDPVISLGVENVPITDPSFDKYLPSSKTIGLLQNIPNPAQRKAQKGVFSQSAQVQKITAEYNRSRLYAVFHTKLAEFKRIADQLVIEEKKKKVIEELKQFYQGEVFAGEPVFQKTLTVELELSEVEKRSNDLRAEKRLVEAKFIQLVGEVPQLTDALHHQKIWSGDTDNLYPVLLAEQKILIADKKIKVMKAEYNPDFGFAATYKNRVDGENDSFDGDDWFSIQIRMTLPLWASSNQEPKLASAKSRKRAAMYDLEDVRRLWKMQMTNLESTRDASHNNIDILNRKKNALEQSIEALKSTYESGQTSLEPSLMAELQKLSLLSRIAKEKENYIRNLQEANAHIYIGN